MSISPSTSSALTTFSSSGSTALTAMSSSSSAAALAPTIALPTEVISRILSHIDSPVDLYRASRASRRWRSIAVDSRLWEKHYWAIYRAPTAPRTDVERLLQARRSTLHHRAMRAWTRLAAQPTPVGPLGPLLESSDDEIRVYTLLCYGMQEVVSGQLIPTLETPQQQAAARRRLRELIDEHGGKPGPDNPILATDLIISTVFKEFGKPPLVDEDGVNAEWKEFIDGQLKPPTAREPSYPPFLRDYDGDEAPAQLPDFYSLFVERMNTDERLILELRTHLGLDCKILDNLFRLVERYGEGARNVLAAIVADQQPNTTTIGRFAFSPGAGGSESKSKKAWPRAIDVHSRAAAGLGHGQPNVGYCLALAATAKHLLGHLQRRDAILSLNKLRNPPSELPFRERVVQCSIAAEESYVNLSLFRSGERGEIKEWLDLLALFVWTDLKDREHLTSDFRLLSRERDAKSKRERNRKSDTATPPGSTRLFVTRIERSLRRLGFCVSVETGGVEVRRNEMFLNTTLFCQSFHATSPRTYAAIICFVARRLGVAMTLIDAVNQISTFAVEDGVKPDDWSPEDGSKWERFYYTPITGGDGRGSVVEAGDALFALAMTEDNPNPEPAEPLNMLATMAGDFRGMYASGLTWGTDEDEEDVSPVPAELRRFLRGRSPDPLLPPWPLLAPVKASSLASLPDPAPGAERGIASNLEDLTTYCSKWALNFAKPNAARGAQGWHLIHQQVYEAVSAEFPRHLDMATILELHGGDVSRELAHIRQGPQGKGNVLAALFGNLMNPDFGAPGRAPDPVRQYIALLLSTDATPCDGMGGKGAGVEVSDPNRSDMELLNHSHPLNRRVLHGIGTVFRHKTFGYRGVIMSWDSKGTEKNGREAKMDFSTLRADGIDQPFYGVYHEDGTRRYVAQCDVEAARIPAGSTPEQAAEILKAYVPLLRVWRVARCFRTLQVNPWKMKTEEEVGPSTSGGKEGKKGKRSKGGGAGGSGGAIKLLMTPWMRKAWPDG